MFDDPPSWEAEIAKNILRDIEAQRGGGALLALRERAKDAFRASQRIRADYDAEKARTHALHPPIPKHLYVESAVPSADGKPQFRPMREEDLAHLSAEDFQRCEPDFKAWQAACTAIDAQHSQLAEKQVAADAADALWVAMDNEFIDTPARTIEDVRVKLEFFATMEDLEETDDDYVSRTVFGLIRDLGKMIGK